MFGLMSVKQHHIICNDLDASWQSSYDGLQKRYLDFKVKHDTEVSNLRNEITGLKNQLALAEGKAVAGAHAKKQPAPKHKAPKP